MWDLAVFPPAEVATTSFTARDPAGPFPSSLSWLLQPRERLRVLGKPARPRCAAAEPCEALKTTLWLENFISLDNILSRCEAPLGIRLYYLPGKGGEGVCAGVGANSR